MGRAGVWALNAAAQSLLATLFPSDCRLCNAPLKKISRLPVCEECLAGVAPIRGATCTICGERIVSPHTGDGRCGDCQIEEPPFSRALAYGSYEGGLRELIHLLKYAHVRPAAAVLGRMLGEVIQELGEEFQTALVIPVPLHASKRRLRGFNQAEEIARAALKHLRSSRLELASGFLERRRATVSQTGLSSHQRRENIQGAFVVQQREKLAGRDIVLVDDVLTTGTTVAEAARVLRRAGADRVLVATVARVLKSEAAFAMPETEPEDVAMAAHA